MINFILLLYEYGVSNIYINKGVPFNQEVEMAKIVIRIMKTCFKDMYFVFRS